MNHPKIVSRQEWLEARGQHLTREKELTRLRDELSRERRSLPWVRVEKPYLFDGPDGKESLAEVFDGRSQLIVYHFMFGPGWEQGCPSCSFLCDHLDATVPHLNARDVTIAAVSRAPLHQIEAFQKRMGWKFRWLSSYASDFNSDYHVSFTREDIAAGETWYNYALRQNPTEGEAPGVSVFCRNDDGEVFHTYSAYARGLDILLGTYNFLDLVPKGRDEDALAFTMAWVRHHDRYGDGYVVDPGKVYEAPRVDPGIRVP